MSSRHRIRSIVPLDDGPWQHPWKVRPRWDGQQWTASIKPGLVNCDDVTVSLHSPSEEIRLTERPLMPLTAFRSVGADATPNISTDGEGNIVTRSEPVPLFFQVRGVGPAPQFAATGSEGILPSRIVQDNANTRLLRACDIVLYADRPGTSSQFTLGTPGESLIVQYAVTFTIAPDARPLPYIRVTSKYQPPLPDDPVARLTGDWSGSQRDELHLATVWLMSPRETPPDSEPDHTWQPFVHHRVYWNLHHSVRNLNAQQADLQLTLNTGLAAGTGDRINAFLLGQANDQNSAISQFLGRTTLAGLFWSA